MRQKTCSACGDASLADAVYARRTRMPSAPTAADG